MSPSAASPKLLIVGCSVEDESVMTGRFPNGLRDACSDGESSSEPGAGLDALVAKGFHILSVCRPDWPEISDVEIEWLESARLVSTSNGCPEVNIVDGFVA